MQGKLRQNVSSAQATPSWPPGKTAQTAIFNVDRAEAYARGFSLQKGVYGNTAGAELRFITCDGYGPAIGQSDDS